MKRTALERFSARYVVEATGCWRWTGGFSSTGYGDFYLAGRHTTAHRAAYELLVGPIPAGLHIDHLCRNRACVNPAHLEPVTLAENNTRAGAVVTECKWGHPYTPENTDRTSRGTRRCRACERARADVRYGRTA